MKIALSFHDFSVFRNRMDLLLTLKEHYPNIKVSMFTIPYDYEAEIPNHHMNREAELKKIKDNLDWIQIIPHGLMHIPNEFEKCDRWTMKMAMQGMDEAFKKDGLPYEKGFCAPYWLWNQDVVDVLNENGWWGSVDRNQPDMIRPNKFYQYNYSINEPFWEAKDVEILKLHGHMTPPSDNNLERCFTNLMKIDRKATFHYVTEFLEDK